MALEEREEVKEHLEDVDESSVGRLDDRKTQAYSNLFFMLQSEPRHLATLCRLISLTEIDGLLQTIMCAVATDTQLTMLGSRSTAISTTVARRTVRWRSMRRR